MYVEKRPEAGDFAVRRAGSKRASDVKPTQIADMSGDNPIVKSPTRITSWT
jgi:hypothetical protein